LALAYRVAIEDEDILPPVVRAMQVRAGKWHTLEVDLRAAANARDLDLRKIVSLARDTLRALRKKTLPVRERLIPGPVGCHRWPRRQGRPVRTPLWARHISPADDITAGVYTPGSPCGRGCDHQVCQPQIKMHARAHQRGSAGPYWYGAAAGVK